MKAYYQYQKHERAELTSDTLNDAIRLEAIERGIRVPVTLPEHLKSQPSCTARIPEKAVCVFKVSVGGYTDGLCYLDEELAKRAVEGAVALSHHYRAKGPNVKYITNPEPKIERVFISGEEWSYSNPVTGYAEEIEMDEKFKALAEECVNDHNSIKQEIYNREVRLEKKKEYLRLAKGDAAIAMSFWNKVEHGAWPTE